MKKIIFLIFILPLFLKAQQPYYLGWSPSGNSVSVGSFLGTTNAQPILFKTNGSIVADFSTSGIFRLYNTPITTTVSGSILYDATLNGISVKTNTSDPSWVFTVDNGACVVAAFPNFITGVGSVYNGGWIGTTTNDNLHFFTNGNGGGVPQLSLTKFAGNSAVIINGNTSYTSTALLRISAGGPANWFECEGATQGVLPFRIQKTGSPANISNLANVGTATFGSTVITAGQPTVNIIGTLNVTGVSTIAAITSSNITSAGSLVLNAPTGNPVDIKINNSTVLDVINTGVTITGNLILPNVGNKIQIKQGVGASVGTLTLAAGTISVANTNITTNSKIFVTARGITNAGHLGTTLSAATGFTITSSSIIDTRIVDYFIIEGQ